MSGFALPKLRWLVLGALAAGGWAMTQEPPSKLRFLDRPEQSTARPKPDQASRKESAARPKTDVARRQDTEIARPKTDIAPRKDNATNRPKAELTASRPAARTSAEPTPPRPVPMRTTAESRPNQPVAGAEVASASQAPIPAPRPTPAAKTASAKPEAPAAPGRETLYTRSSASMHQRATLAAPVLLRLKQGESVQVFARDGKWALVMAAGRRGWVHVDNLRSADPDAPRPQQPLVQPAKAG
ncbi:MAG: hypothetical protein ABS35_15565 [Kaistia sp. SCN 65-12]|nr:MAG: hypothetical protein ABS35_15565 [Kaistia sp. SCN 65-12]